MSDGEKPGDTFTKTSPRYVWKLQMKLFPSFSVFIESLFFLTTCVNILVEREEHLTASSRLVYSSTPQ